MQVGDIVVFLHLPEYGVWSIARVTGGYRYEVSDIPNSWNGANDYGHIRDVQLLTGNEGLAPASAGASDDLRKAMRNRIRMWSIDAHSDEIGRLIGRGG